MKRLFVTLCAALLGMGAQAQQKGDFALGVHAGMTFTEVEFINVKESTRQLGIGVFGQYSLSKHWRLELEGTYHPMTDHVSDLLTGLTVHYLINLDKGDRVKLYPLLGYGVQFVHSETYTEDGFTFKGDNETDGGIQLGAGLQVNVGQRWFVSGEYKYQPGIFADANVVMLGVGYRF